MGRSKHCRICDHPEIATINSLIESGVRQAVIHEQFPRFSISQISRHGRNCLVKPPVDLSNDTEADVWLKRLESAHAQSVVDGNIAGQIAACGQAGRALERARKVKAAKADAELPSDCHRWSETQGAQFRAYIDSVVREATEKSGPDSSVAQMNWLYSLSAETLTLFRRVTANPALLAQVQQLETNFLTQRPTSGETNNAGSPN